MSSILYKTNYFNYRLSLYILYRRLVFHTFTVGGGRWGGAPSLEMTNNRLRMLSIIYYRIDIIDDKFKMETG